MDYRALSRALPKHQTHTVQKYCHHSCTKNENGEKQHMKLLFFFSKLMQQLRKKQEF